LTSLAMRTVWPVAAAECSFDLPTCTEKKGVREGVAKKGKEEGGRDGGREKGAQVGKKRGTEGEREKE
jgi:hypothetical protein